MHNFIKQKPPIDLLVKFTFEGGGMFLGKYQGNNIIRCHEAGDYYNMDYRTDLTQSELINLQWAFIN